MALLVFITLFHDAKFDLITPSARVEKARIVHRHEKLDKLENITRVFEVIENRIG